MLQRVSNNIYMRCFVYMYDIQMNTYVYSVTPVTGVTEYTYVFICISLKCWDGQYCRDALQRITIQCDRGTRHCARERLVPHSASDTVTTMKKTLCERGVIQRNTLRRDV